MIIRAAIVFTPLVGLLMLISPLLPLIILTFIVLAAVVIASFMTILTAILWVFDPEEAKKKVKEFFSK